MNNTQVSINHEATARDMERIELGGPVECPETPSPWQFARKHVN